MTNKGTGRHRHAVVVGGSLAGLMTALGLARVGFAVTVLERSGSAPRSGGALGNAEDNLHRILGPDGLAGAEAAAVAAGRRSRLQTWEEAHRLLRAAAEADPRIELVHDTRVVEVNQDAGSAWAVTDGRYVHRGEVLIGADGHRSVVRRHVAPDHAAATYAGYVIWLGIADESELDLPGPWPSELDILDGRTDCLLGYPMDDPEPDPPTGQRLGWAWFDPRRNDLLRTAGCVEGEVVQHSMRPEDVPAELLAELDDEARQWSSPWREAIRTCIRRRGVTGTPIAEYVPSHLVQGRVALVGDAAHVSTPMTGRGFTVSLSDAEILTDELAENTHDVAAALRGYERRSLGPAREIVESGRRFSRSFATAF
jgi:2-polyprenyl-6-methoxyphenol hydroxylase-like FAD-dependent oxidoreductase